MGIINAYIPHEFEEGKDKAIENLMDLYLQIAPSNERFYFSNLLGPLVASNFPEFKTHHRELSGKANFLMREYNYINTTSNIEEVWLTEKGRSAKEAGGHYKYSENLLLEKEKAEKRMEDFIFYQSEMARGFANQGVLLLTIAEELHNIRRNSNDKRSYAQGVGEFLKEVGVNISSAQIGEILGKYEF